MKAALITVLMGIFLLTAMGASVKAMEQSTNYSHIKVGAQNFWSNYLTGFTEAQKTAIRSWQANHLDIATGGAILSQYNSNTLSGGYVDSVHLYHVYTYKVKEMAALHGYNAEDIFWHAKKNYRVLDGQKRSGMNRFDAGEANSLGQYVNGVFLLNGVTYTDKTTAAFDATAGDITLDDKLFIGYSDPFADINFTVSTPNATKAVAIEYWNGTVWSTLSVTDGTNGLRQNGLVTFVPPSDWTTVAVNGSRSKYWVRYTVTGAGTSPVISSILGDDWLAAGDGTNNTRGWDATSPTIVGTGDLAYNPTPPSTAQAKFRYQARITGLWGPNATFGNQSNTQNNERTWATFLAYDALNILKVANGNMMMFDDGNTNPSISSVFDFIADTDWQEGAGTVLQERTNSFEYAKSLVQATYPSVKVGILCQTQNLVNVGDWNMNENFSDVTNLLSSTRYTAGNGDSTYSTSFDGYLTTNDPTSEAGIMMFIDAYSTGKTDQSGNWFYWDRGNRGPIAALAAYYMGANSNTYFAYNNGGNNYVYYNSPGTYYYWSPPSLSTTLTQELTAGPSGTYDIYGVDFSAFPDTNASYLPYTPIRVGTNIFKAYYKISNTHLRLYPGVPHVTAPVGALVQFEIQKNIALDPFPSGVEFSGWGMWFPAIEANVGTPLEPRNMAWKLWSDIGGSAASSGSVLKRDYTHALILLRPSNYNMTAVQVNTPSSAIDLGGTYYPLLANGVTGAAITSIQLRTGEGAILMRDPIYAPSATPAPPVDTTLPTALLTSPTDSALVSGVVPINVSAADNVGVSKVEFYVNNMLQSTDPAPAPYTFAWDTTTVANGTYTLSAKVFDTSGNMGQSGNVSVTVNNPVPDMTPPTVSMTAPANNSTVSGSISVAASASDNVGISKVEFYVNGGLQATSTTAPYSSVWNTATVANGSYSLSARAYDAAGNVGQSVAIVVKVDNDKTPPTVAITSPVKGAVVSGTTTVNVSATDNVAVAKVELYINGALFAVKRAAPYSFSWSTSFFPVGTNTITAYAYDSIGNKSLASSVPVVVKDSIAPLVNITSPSSNQVVTTRLTIAASATDNVNVVKMQLYFDGLLISTVNADTLSRSMDTSKINRGAHTIMIRAYDAAGNVGKYYVSISKQ